MDAITCEQLFSRSSLGFLWAKRDQLDPGQRSILDALYLGRKKGSIDGSIKVEYRLPKTGVGKLGFGRCYGTKGSLETLERECRGTMCREFYDDVDVINCHPVLLHQFAQRNYQVEMPEVEKYCDNRAEFLAKVSDKKEDAKQAIIKVFYNGKNDFPHLAPMALEIKNFIKRHLMDDDTYKELLTYVRKQENNTYGSFLSHVLQTEERKVMMAMRQSFINQGFSVDVLAYDGVMLRKGKKSLEVSALREAEDFIHHTTNYRINLLIKPFEFFEVTEEQKEEVEEVAPKVKKTDYERNKTMFEESHFYFATTNEIVEVSAMGRLNYEKLEHAQIKYVSYDFKHSNNLMDKTNFIKLWLNDPSRRTIHTVDMRPSDDPLVYTPPLLFRYTSFPEAHHEEAIRLFQELVCVLCNHSPAIYHYTISWIAYMIQSPFKNPGTAIFFTGKKGCGKDTLGDFLVDWVVGDTYAHNYPETSQYWDKHDVSREHRILIKLEEADSTLNHKNSEAFKGRITAPTITINDKGLKPRTSYNANHVIGTTNSGLPAKAEEGERRYNIFPASPEWVGKMEVWKRIRCVLFCPDGASSVGHYLATLPLDDFDPRVMPKNEYLAQAIEAGISPEKSFLMQWDGEQVSMVRLYAMYVEYCQGQQMYYASNTISFGKRLMEHIRDGLLKKTVDRTSSLYQK